MKQGLLLIDIQNDYFDGGSNPLMGSCEASLKAKAVLEMFRTKSLLVIHTRFPRDGSDLVGFPLFFCYQMKPFSISLCL